MQPGVAVCYILCQQQRKFHYVLSVIEDKLSFILHMGFVHASDLLSPANQVSYIRVYRNHCMAC